MGEQNRNWEKWERKHYSEKMGASKIEDKYSTEYLVRRKFWHVCLLFVCVLYIVYTLAETRYINSVGMMWMQTRRIHPMTFANAMVVCDLVHICHHSKLRAATATCLQICANVSRMQSIEWLLHAWEYHFVCIFCSCRCWF